MKTKDNAQLKRKKRNNQIKGLLILATVSSLLLSGYVVIAVLTLLVFYILNEVLWSDHIFYDRQADYTYQFHNNISIPCTLQQGKLTFDKLQLHNAQAKSSTNTATSFTSLLEMPIKSTLFGRIYDPYVTISCEGKQQRQYFERGLKGRRYINVSDLLNIQHNHPIDLQFHYCKALSSEGNLIHFNHEDYTQKKVMVLAPHADDAELAAFGLYSQSDAHIVTITAGEIEMEDYFNFLPPSNTSPGTLIERASRLKGRLRTWDSLAIPLWGNTPVNRCIQLGYFCLTLKEMHETPDKPVNSRTANTNSTATFRHSNQQTLESDNNHNATWNNLVQDLKELINDIQPEVIVTPHPELDPHQDHFYTTKALIEALPDTSPTTLLLYANHYRSTDHYGFGPANSNIGLPPNFDGNLLSPSIVSLPLSEDTQIDKALSLAMMHDLQSTPSFKKRLRRSLQHWLCRRNHYRYGNNDFFAKSVKQQEVFIASSVSAIKNTLGSHL